MKRIVSGIKPTGELHIGNYLGAIAGWVEHQHDFETFIFIADYHALTTRPKKSELTENTYHVAAMLIALGIDPKSTTLFLQSSVPAQTELAWILSNFVSMGQLNRMTQYKEKSEKYGQNAGLFTYPILMTADIAAYRATHVPVGDDQIQHLELAREIVRSFNNHTETNVLIEPEAILTKAPRIMSLCNPGNKMSKTTPGNAIGLLDSEDMIIRTIKRAVTDSDPNTMTIGPAVANLLSILEGMSEPMKVKELLEDRKNGRLSYSELKELLTEEVLSFLKPVQKTYHKLIEDKETLQTLLEKGNKRAQDVASTVLTDVRKALGIIGTAPVN